MCTGREEMVCRGDVLQSAPMCDTATLGGGRSWLGAEGARDGGQVLWQVPGQFR